MQINVSRLVFLSESKYISKEVRGIPLPFTYQGTPQMMIIFAGFKFSEMRRIKYKE